MNYLPVDELNFIKCCLTARDSCATLDEAALVQSGPDGENTKSVFRMILVLTADATMITQAPIKGYASARLLVELGLEIQLNPKSFKFVQATKIVRRGARFAELGQFIRRRASRCLF